MASMSELQKIRLGLRWTVQRINVECNVLLLLYEKETDTGFGYFTSICRVFLESR